MGFSLKNGNASQHEIGLRRISCRTGFANVEQMHVVKALNKKRAALGDPRGLGEPSGEHPNALHRMVSALDPGHH